MELSEVFTSILSQEVIPDLILVSFLKEFYKPAVLILSTIYENIWEKYIYCRLILAELAMVNVKPGMICKNFILL